MCDSEIKCEKMSGEVKRGDVKMANSIAEQDEEDGELPTLTAICFVGQELSQNSKLTQDAKTFGYKILHTE